jgi:hypothetical protein
VSAASSFPLKYAQRPRLVGLKGFQPLKVPVECRLLVGDYLTGVVNLLLCLAGVLLPPGLNIGSRCLNPSSFRS